MSSCDDSKYILQEIELMRSQVVEVASSGNVRLKSPRQVVGILIVKVSWRNRETYLDMYDCAYSSRIDDALYLLKIRQIASVVSHKARHPRNLAYAIDAGAVFIACS